MIDDTAMKKQKNNYTFYYAEPNIGAVAQQPHGHWKDKTSSEGVSAFG